MSLPLYQIGLHRYRFRRGIGPSGMVRNRVGKAQRARTADLQQWFDDRIAGNFPAVNWYENTRRKPPNADPEEPVNA